MTWIGAAAKQIARGDTPTDEDKQEAKALFIRVNKKRVEAGLKPFTN